MMSSMLRLVARTRTSTWSAFTSGTGTASATARCWVMSALAAGLPVSSTARMVAMV